MARQEASTPDDIIKGILLTCDVSWN